MVVLCRSSISIWCTFIISNAEFIQNRANHGGAAYLSYVDISSLSDCLFQKNEAETSSGGIFFYEIIEVSMKRTTFIRNKVSAADSTECGGGECGGGGIYVKGSGILSIRESTFVENRAQNDGGHQVMTNYHVPYFKPPTLIIVKTNFSNIYETENNYIVYDGTVRKSELFITPNNCTSNPCSGSSFTGSCTVHPMGPKRGVLCDYINATACPIGFDKRCRHPTPRHVLSAFSPPKEM